MIVAKRSWTWILFGKVGKVTKLASYLVYMPWLQKLGHVFEVGDKAEKDSWSVKVCSVTMIKALFHCWEK